MACYHPMKGFVVGKTENGKKDLKIAPYDTECVFQPLGSETWERHGHVLDRLTVQGRVVTDFVPIPCGQCVGCRLEYSRQWAVRCMLESEYHENNYFLTITYDDKHVPWSSYVDDDGVFQEIMTLDKSHLQKFCKDLRSHLDYDNLGTFRFYACGEYGSISARPHYHMIAFGLNIDKTKFVKYGDYPTGTLYTSEYLDNIWKRGKIWLGSVTFESCAYVSRYIMKKQKGKGLDVYSYYNIVPEFVNMSRKPGIGRTFFDDNFQDIYPADNLVLPGGRCVTPPRYFDILMNEIDEELMDQIKEKRCDIAKSIQSYKDTLISADYQKQLEYAENNKSAQVKKLVRPL